jgi:hypothetical protein
MQLLLLAQTLKDSVPVEVATQVPGLYVALAACVVVVVAFLAFLSLERNANTKERQDTRSFIASLTESDSTAHAIEGAANRTMMAECATALKQNTSALASNAEVLRDVRDWVDEQRNKQ